MTSKRHYGISDRGRVQTSPAVKRRPESSPPPCSGRRAFDLREAFKAFAVMVPAAVAIVTILWMVIFWRGHHYDQIRARSQSQFRDAQIREPAETTREGASGRVPIIEGQVHGR
jgi:hypothetical protein